MSSNRMTDFSVIFVVDPTTESDPCTGSNRGVTMAVDWCTVLVWEIPIESAKWPPDHSLDFYVPVSILGRTGEGQIHRDTGNSSTSFKRYKFN